MTNFVYYYWYEWARAGFEKAAVTAGRASKKLTTVESMVAGAIAGSATVLITNPIWVVNTRMTARKNQSEDQALPGPDGKAKPAPSTLGTLIALLRQEGVKALFAGVLPALVLVINPILQYTIFEQLKNGLEKRRKVTATDVFYLGAIGKLLATSITYPYITVKSRAHVAAKDAPQQGMIGSLKKIFQDEGWMGLYSGEWPFFPDREPENAENAAERRGVRTGTDQKFLGHRHRTQSQSKCTHGRLLVRFQRCTIRPDGCGEEEKQDSRPLNLDRVFPSVRKQKFVLILATISPPLSSKRGFSCA